MKDLRDIVAKNIATLRTEAGLTQLKLAEKLNYSDKAVSKWERGESVPDIFMLKEIADTFGVTVDYLLTEEHNEEQIKNEKDKRVMGKNRILITFLATSLVWLIATAAFVILNIAAPEALLRGWMMFIYAIPASAIVVLVFNSIWGRVKLNYLIISLLVWALILSAYMTVLTLLTHNMWLLFILGIPAQVIIVFWSGITGKVGRNAGNKR